MNYAMIQNLKYIFDGYSLIFILGTSIYGLIVDVKQSRDKGTNRDAKIAKRIYITLIALIISAYIIIRII